VTLLLHNDAASASCYTAAVPVTDMSQCQQRQMHAKLKRGVKITSHQQSSVHRLRDALPPSRGLNVARAQLFLHAALEARGRCSSEHGVIAISVKPTTLRHVMKLVQKEMH
jgi:hypothetical protein